MSAFYAPVIMGFYDAFSLLFLSLAYLLIFDNYLDYYNLEKSIYLALTLLLTLFGRRYFAFAVTGFAITVIFSCIIKLAIVSEKKERFYEYLKNGLVVIFSMGIPMLFFFRGFIRLSITGNLKVAYSGYQARYLTDNYKNLINYFGAIVVIFIVVIFIGNIIQKNNMEYIGFNIASMLITTVLFFNVQSMAMQHYYIVIIPIVLLVIQGVVYVYKHRCRYSTLVAIIVMTISFTLSLSGNSVTFKNMNLFSNCKLSPVVRKDLPQLQLLTNYLKQYSDEGKTIYVLASSEILNDDILRRINMPDMLESVPNLCSTSHVDLRDGFSTDFLTADYVVVANPIQVHLNLDNQRVISLLADEFISQKPLSDNYNEMESFKLDNGVVATIYERTLPFNEYQIQYLRELFNQYYSDYPQLFGDRIN